eukprot:Skav219240  [mRNA]  locus=scaffold1242:124851:126662:- [translate_table: standard]
MLQWSSWSSSFQLLRSPEGILGAPGASLVSFYLRVGGGIFSKGAEIGADLVGEMSENKLDEERPGAPGVRVVVRVYELQQRMAEMESLRQERRKKGGSWASLEMS